MSGPTLSWAKQSPVLNTDAYDVEPSMVKDSSGNIYIAYSSNSTVSGGSRSGAIAVTKMDTTGKIVWIKQSVGSVGSTSTMPKITIDTSGNIYIGFNASGTLSGGTSGANVAVFKLDNNGNTIWIKQYLAMTNQVYGATLTDIAADSSGNIYIVGISYLGSLSGGTNLGGHDIFISKWDTNGNIIFIMQNSKINTAGTNNYPKLVVTSTGTMYISYTVSDTVSSGQYTGGNSDIVVMKVVQTGTGLNATGGIVWIKQQPIQNSINGGDDYSDIAIDSSENIYVTYTTSGTVSGGTNIGGAGSEKIVVFKMDSNGNVVWIKQDAKFNSTGQDAVSSIDVDSAGNCYIAYPAIGTVSGGAINNMAKEIVVFKLDINGNTSWIAQQPAFNTTKDDSYANVVVDSSGNIFVAYQSDVDGVLQGNTLISGKNINVFKLLPPPPTSATEAVSANQISSYVNNQTTTTDTQKTTLAVDMRTAIKNATYASNAAKAAQQLDYINAMKTKVGASYTVPTGSFASFTATMATVVGGIETKPVISYFPTFSGTTATVNVAAVATTNYIHSEVPVGYSVTFQNGLNTVTLTNNGSSYTDGTNTYTTNTSFVLGEKRYTIVGIGSLFINPSNRNVECMVEGTQILTPAGYVPIETLKEGDQVITGTKEIAPISNFHKVIVLRATEQNAPYIIEKDAFGANCPPNRLEVSPRHAIQLEPGLWEMPREAAKDNKRVYQNKDVIGKQVVYYHFSLPNYETDTIVANGQITECLNDGKKVSESYVWNKQRHGYIRATKSIEKKNTLSV